MLQVTNDCSSSFERNIPVFRDLDSNKIRHLHSGSVKMKTEMLNLDFNLIRTIEGRAFEGSEIAKLSLKGNTQLHSIHEDAFSGLKNVRTLDLSETSINYLPVKGLEELDVLKLTEVYPLKVFPSVYHFKYIKEAYLTYPYHCCAFKFPATHDPEEFSKYIDFKKNMENLYCRQNPSTTPTTWLALDAEKNVRRKRRLHQILENSFEPPIDKIGKYAPLVNSRTYYSTKGENHVGTIQFPRRGAQGSLSFVKERHKKHKGHVKLLRGARMVKRNDFHFRERGVLVSRDSQSIAEDRHDWIRRTAEWGSIPKSEINIHQRLFSVFWCKWILSGLTLNVGFLLRNWNGVLDTPSNVESSTELEKACMFPASSVNQIDLPSSTDFVAIAAEQKLDTELRKLLVCTAPENSLNLQPMQLSQGTTLYCDVRDAREFFQPMDTSIVLDPTKFVHKLRDCMSSLKPVPTSAHCKRSPFVQKDLLTSTHVFLRIDSLRKSLEPTYSGPHEVLARQEKTFRIKINNKEAVDILLNSSDAEEFFGSQLTTKKRKPKMQKNFPENPFMEGVFHGTTVAVISEFELQAFCGQLAKNYRDVECYPTPDAFNPCEDVMGNMMLRAFVWVVVGTSILGNVAVMVVLMSTGACKSVSKFLMCNLAFADFCMGVYLLLIAAMDLHSMGTYFNYAIDWQHGIGCKIAGFLTVFATELSIYTLTVISIERWYAITYAINLSKRLKLRRAAKIMSAGWLFALTMSSLPLINVNGYSRTSICLPMKSETTSDIIYLLILLGTNSLTFIFIFFCYGNMYISVIRHQSRATANDMAVAKRMAMLVITDFLCWAPVAFFATTAVAGYPLIDVTKSKILLVFFYPLNSCANPFLYAIFTTQYRRDFLILLKRCEGFLERTSKNDKNSSCNVPPLQFSSDIKYWKNSCSSHLSTDNSMKVLRPSDLSSQQDVFSTSGWEDPEAGDVIQLWSCMKDSSSSDDSGQCCKNYSSSSHSTTTHRGSPHPVKNRFVHVDRTNILDVCDIRSTSM
ncbi:uncharacterized protein LOC129226966 [Uloborus diversus]|uniref:uncharacterized protein LOC129226966 n=1 Tax=Uloborus diversus TaxID=327109 RepID=UPI00240956A3|nr:uncharacterized protein LOC129226966 [Uloborus diversus]